MDKIKILWADDEIDLLKPQLLFLEKKGYEVITVSNGYDAIEEFDQQKDIDVIFLDESMPGLTGLETLAKLKEGNSNVPVVMITKNEAETVMEEAIGSQIDDYLIKPVNPNQILLTLKKIIDNKRLVREKTASDYQVEFRQIFMEINNGLSFDDWTNVYRKIINWELKLDDSRTEEMADILSMQKSEANAEFSKYISRNYTDWLQGKEEGPILSHQLIRKKVLPLLQEKKPIFLVVLDNLRFDQWKIIERILINNFRIMSEDFFYSILPTSTQYSRNAIFAGMLPSEIEKHFPKYWKNDTDEGGKNLHEKELLQAQLKRLVRDEIKMDYIKITNTANAQQLDDQILNYLHNDLTVIVYNFIDMMSHARTEMEVLKELASDERAYRSLTNSWFVHSPLWTALQTVSDKDVTLIVTTDHGTIRVKQPSKVVGDRETTTNLRYKLGRNLRYESKDVFEMRDPEKIGLPRPNLSSSFIFAKEDKYFLYPNNYNYYNNYFRNTFQHGGISMEEMICPIVTLSGK
ncbi:MAG: PglZ domain-containing protein [Saprospiraceae bacterium]|nr:PglZ domain-containing protein [Saprospiraceae bacterium]